MSDEAEFELICDGVCEASASGPREQAWREILHYARQYAQDGSVQIFEVKRVPRSLPSEDEYNHVPPPQEPT